MEKLSTLFFKSGYLMGRLFVFYPKQIKAGLGNHRSGHQEKLKAE